MTYLIMKTKKKLYTDFSKLYYALAYTLQYQTLYTGNEEKKICFKKEEIILLIF